MAQTPQIVTAARRFRAELLRGEGEASADMVRLYTSLYESTRARLQAVSKEIADEIAKGAKPGAARVYEKGRLERIMGETATEIKRFSGSAEKLITARQKEIVALAQDHAAEFGRAALGKLPAGASGPTWAKVPTASLEDLAGVSSNGSPLNRILGQLGNAGANQVREAMLQGVAQGNTAEAIAADLSGRLGTPLARTLTVLRTEDMRAYRMSQTRAYIDNRDIIKGVRWFASLSPDTCASCIMQHGKLFDPDYVMETHPNCRCVLVPETKSWVDLGIPGARRESKQAFESGADWFHRQDARTQEKVLGKAGYDAFANHGVGLQHFGGYRKNEEWGGMHYTRSATAAIAAAKAEK